MIPYFPLNYASCKSQEEKSIITQQNEYYVMELLRHNTTNMYIDIHNCFFEFSFSVIFLVITLYNLMFL